MNKYFFNIFKNINGSYSVYIVRYLNNKSHVCYFNDESEIKFVEIDEFQSLGSVNPTFNINQHDSQFFKAMVEGLKNAGYVAEVDNKQRITAEALAEERKENLDYFKNMFTDFFYSKSQINKKDDDE